MVDTISSDRPGRAPLASCQVSRIVSGSVRSVPPQPVPGSATWKYRPGVDRRPLMRMPEGSHPMTLPAWCPQVLLVRRGHRPERIALSCDTLKIDTDQQTLSLIARAAVCPSVTGGLPAWLLLQACSAWPVAA